MTIPPAPQHKIGDDEKLTPIMLYTSHSMIWGQVFSKQAIRVSTWLLTDMVPTYLKIYDAQQLIINSGQTIAPIKAPVLYLQIKNINAYHLMPPITETLDYDPSEPNRKMVPTTAMVGYFRFEGFSRMASFTDMDNYLSSAKAEYMSLYEAKMTCLVMPSIKGMQSPTVYVRQHRTIFTVQEEN